ncbi:uncharacterized protein ACNLHF_019117 [Anomaloglossus baeobatrachus]
MIELLIGMDKRKLDELEKEIESLNDEIKQKLSKEALMLFEKEVAEELNQLESDVKQRKMRKYQRDITDYRNKTVFRWHHDKQNQRRNTPRSTIQSSSESIASSESGSGTYNDGQNRHMAARSGVETRNGAKRRQNQSNWKKEGPYVKDALKSRKY